MELVLLLLGFLLVAWVARFNPKIAASCVAVGVLLNVSEWTMRFAPQMVAYPAVIGIWTGTFWVFDKFFWRKLKN